MCGRDHMSIVCCFTYSEFVTVSTRSIKPVLNRTHHPSPQIYNRNIISYNYYCSYNNNIDIANNSNLCNALFFIHIHKDSQL